MPEIVNRSEIKQVQTIRYVQQSEKQTYEFEWQQSERPNEEIILIVYNACHQYTVLLIAAHNATIIASLLHNAFTTLTHIHWINVSTETKFSCRDITLNFNYIYKPIELILIYIAKIHLDSFERK